MARCAIELYEPHTDQLAGDGLHITWVEVRGCCLELVDARALDLVQVFEDPTAQRQAVTQTLGELGEREKAPVLVYRANLLAHVLLGPDAQATVPLASSRLQPPGSARASSPHGPSNTE